MRSTSTKHFHFGPFTLDGDAAELLNGEERVALRPKCYDLLLFFLQNPGKLITKETLLEKFWSDVVVAEATLGRTIAEVREALQDDAEVPSYIETVPRRGYRFIAPIQRLTLPTAGQGDFSLVHGAQEHPLHDGENLIGRGSDVGIRLYTALISRHHARVVVDGPDVTVEDLGSTNGTRVNGQKITRPVVLKLGDQIAIGSEVLVLSSPTAATSPAPP